MSYQKNPLVYDFQISSHEVDRAFELNSQIKKLKKELDDIKTRLRQEAQRAGARKGNAVEVVGRSRKASVVFVHDSVDVGEVDDLTLKRIGVMIGNEAIKITKDVKLKNDRALSRLKEVLGEEFNELLLEDSTREIDSSKVSSWLEENEGVDNEQVQERVAFVKTFLTRKASTPRVTF